MSHELLPMLQTDSLTIQRGGRLLIQNLNLALGTGCYALIGPNGCGKTSFFDVVTGVRPPQSGRVSIAGHDLAYDHQAAKSALAYVPDDCAVFPFLSGDEYLHFMVDLRKQTWADCQADLDSAIADYGLDAHRHTRFGAMSLGTRRKFLLIGSTIASPPVLLLDEPFNGLDKQSRHRFIEDIRDWSRTRLVLLSSHDAKTITACEAHELEVFEANTGLSKATDQVLKH